MDEEVGANAHSFNPKIFFSNFKYFYLCFKIYFKIRNIGDIGDFKSFT